MLVVVKPKGEDAAGVQLGARDLEELLGEQARDTRDPGIGGLGDDDVVATRHGAQEALGVIFVNPSTWIGQHTVVVLFKDPICVQHAARDLDHVEPLDRRMEQRGSRRRKTFCSTTI